MGVRFPAFGPLLVLCIAANGCGRTGSPPTAPAPAASVPLSITAEPAALRPEPISGPGCVAGNPFGLRLTLVLQGRSDLIVRNVRFEFHDRFGQRALPAVNTLPEPGSASIATASPVPIPAPGAATLPGAGPVTIPGAAPMHGLFVPGERSSAIRFFLAFDCGVLSEGTLVVIVDAADTSGQPVTSQLRVGVRS
jgi:hypothetical protein